MSENHVRAPFSAAQVASLNAYQESGVFHPFTCEPRGHLLVATPAGWVCIAADCPYTQDWAWSWMADGSWRAAPRPGEVVSEATGETLSTSTTATTSATRGSLRELLAAQLAGTARLRGGRARTARRLRALRQVVGLTQDWGEVWRDRYHEAIRERDELRAALEHVADSAWPMSGPTPNDWAAEFLLLDDAGRAALLGRSP